MYILDKSLIYQNSLEILQLTVVKIMQHGALSCFLPIETSFYVFPKLIGSLSRNDKDI